jgi:hypothetical protein
MPWVPHSHFGKHSQLLNLSFYIQFCPIPLTTHACIQHYLVVFHIHEPSFPLHDYQHLYISNLHEYNTHTTALVGHWY